MRNHWLTIIYRVILLALFAGCASELPFYGNIPNQPEGPPTEEPVYSVFLIGDTGNSSKTSPNPALEVLQSKLFESGKKSAVVFLGDNLYPDGLPTEDHPSRSVAEEKLMVQLNLLKEYTGRIFFIPGNHDWSSSGRDGLDAVNRMEQFIESNLDRGNVFLPDNGFPGPVDIKLMDKDDDPSLTRDIHLIIIDTQWWLHSYDKPYGDNGSFNLHDNGNFLNELTDVMRKRQNDHLIVAGHHPVFSNGNHGGYFSPVTHLTPPVIGTIYVLYRKIFGLQQDIPHYRYRSLRSELMDAFNKSESLVYAAGHEHILQHTVNEGRRREQHYVVSGSGSKSSYAVRGRGADFVSNQQGFAVINYYGDRSSWLEFWNGNGERLYQRQLISPEENPFRNTQQAHAAHPDKGKSLSSDSTVTVSANSDYDRAGWLHRALLGSHNRNLWSIPAEIPLFDIATVKDGGLEAEKMGGTGQTSNLRLTDRDGRSYVLRSVNKEAGRIWDPTLRKTFAEDLAQDQFSILNPYGALIIPTLAEAVNVYHTRPEIFVIPEDPRLGLFSEQLKGQLALFEERPDGDMSHAPHLSGSDDVVSTREMFRKVDADIDHRVDQEMMLRNRLLDILISDWDRHEDQWRWATFEPAGGNGKIYQPIPRDRDMAFFVMNGLIPSIGKTSFFSQYQDFRHSYGNLKGLTYNSLSLTRRFTNQLLKNEWIAIADSMKAALTDSVIDRAVSQMPDSVTEAAGENIATILKARRDRLPDAALQYYNLLSKVVDVPGSHKREKFVVEFTGSGNIQVQVYKLDKDGNPRGKYYERMFFPDETEELRLYGLGGEDIFEVHGEENDAFKIRIIGGPDEDTFKENTTFKRKRIEIYDTVKGSRIEGKDKFRVHFSDSQTNVNSYDYDGFRYNTSQPLFYFGSNRDDGVFIGGGASIHTHGFRKYPAKAIHRIRANFAVKTQAYNIRYDGFYGDLAGEWDGQLKLDILFPNNIRNFYGLGNETEDQSRDDDYYQARLQQYRLRTSLLRTLGTGLTVSGGPHFQITQVREDEGRFIGQPQAGISNNTFQDQWLTGLHSRVEFQDLDNTMNPMQGFRWVNEAQLNLGVKNTSTDYSTLSSSLSFYVSPLFDPQITLATRFGIHHNIGSYPFYESQTLGGKRSLRGLLSNRYAGRTSYYNNIELRSKMFDFHNYLIGGEAGLIAFFDYGRVWTDGERSNKWHYGTGGGAWMSVFNMTIVHGSIGFSEGSYNILLGAGFFF